LQFDKGVQGELLSFGPGYTESLGSPELRSLISSLCTKSTPEIFFVHFCSEKPIFNFINVVFNQGDEIIVPSPSYQSLDWVARSIGAIAIECKSSSKHS